MRSGLQPHVQHFASPRMAIFGHLRVRPGRARYRASINLLPDRRLGTTDSESDIAKRRRLEAVLFLSPQGISSRKAAKSADLADATEVRTLIRQLNQFYDCQFKPYRIEEVAGGYTVVTRGKLAPWLRKLPYIPGEVRLSRSALETLAIVAYRQPVMRADIEAIRGVGSSEVLKQLMELDLVRISGRSEELGRPYLYGTTQRFLQMFGLRSADRLPRIEWVSLSAPVDTTTSSEDIATESEVKESTVKRTFAATQRPGTHSVDELLMKATATDAPIFAIDDEDDDLFDDEDDDEDDDDDFEDDEDDLDDWEEEEEDLVDEEEDSLDEIEEEEADKVEEEEEEDDAWEEVDDDDAEEADDEEDDWDDDEDDDWDDDDEEEDDEDWE